MEKYLKMPDGFNGGAEWFGNAMRDDMTASDVLIDAAVHAINSHDELVAMNKELLEALESLDDCYSDTSREYLSRSELLHHKAVRADVHAIIDKAKASS